MIRHDEFLQQHADTRCFSLGIPHTFTVSPDGRAVFFLRSLAIDDPLTCLWMLDLTSGEEQMLLDPRTLDTRELDAAATSDEPEPGSDGEGPQAARQSDCGIVGYTADAASRWACLVAADGLWISGLEPGAVPRLLAAGRFDDPRLDPSGGRVVFVQDGDLCAIDVADGARSTIAADDDPDVTYGLPEYVAGEMRRTRGYWWSPDGSQLVVARVDSRSVGHWHVSNPATPASAPDVIVRAMAGRANAEVTLSILGEGHATIPIEWDRARFEYLVDCCWSTGGLLVTVQSRNQDELEIYEVDPRSGETALRHRGHDPSWVTTFPGLPVLLSTGELAHTRMQDDTHMLFVGDEPVTPVGLQLIDVYGLDADRLLFAATADSTETHVWAYSPDAGLHRLSEEAGVHAGAGTATTAVIARDALELERPVFTIRRGGETIAGIATAPQPPGLRLRVELLSTGSDRVRTALLLPVDHEPDDGPLPVLLDPYGGLALRKVLNARTASVLVSQWFAEQGFAVIVADGHGTPGRGPAWERAIRGDIETLPIADQVDALHDVAERHPGLLDLNRVAIRGWSWGGFLSAACVLRRPDVFHAGISGAAVFNHLLYHSYWKERQLGHPDEYPARYERHALARSAHEFRRPLLLIHGLSDDNVFPAHTLGLSAALMDAGRTHEVLLLAGHDHHAIRGPLSGYIFKHQLEFLQRALGMAQDGMGATSSIPEVAR